jgi:hypothetical protein
MFGASVGHASGDAPWCAVINIGVGDVSWDCRYRTVEECVPNVIAGNRGFFGCSSWELSPLSSASHPQRRLSLLLKAIGQFPFITEKISEQTLVKATLVLLPRPLQKSAGTLGPGLAIQRGDRMCMFRAWRRVGNSFSTFAIYSPQSPAPRRA